MPDPVSRRARRSWTHRRWWAAAVCSSTLALIPGFAFAQSPADVAARRDLILHARDASRAGDHARALEFATHASGIQMTPSLRMFIAQEQNALGQLADALGNADLCAQEASADNSLPDRNAIVTSCRSLSESIRPRVGHLTVAMTGTLPEGVHVTIQGRPLNEAFYNVPYVVSPGPIVVEATAPGRQPFHREISVGIGADARVDVALEPVPTAATVPPQPPPTPVATPETQQPAVEQHANAPAPESPTTTPPVAPLSPAPSHEDHGGGSTAPLVVAGIGAVALIVGGAIIGTQQFQLGDFHRNYCQASTDQTYWHCVDSDAAHRAYGNIESVTGIGEVVLAAGGVALVGGAIWWLATGHGSRERRTGITVSPMTAGTGVVLSGSF